jgi:isoquinoline 1-oxidoreductase alpha subunit
VNGRLHALDIDPGTPLLWALRDHLHLYGAKYGCGIGLCGACTVLVDDQAVRACRLSVADAAGKAVTTIEGLAPGREPVQLAWQALQVPQCGYCQPGMIMTAAALLLRSPSPSDEEITEAMSGSVCRCGTFDRMRRAIRRAAAAEGS